MSVITKIRLGFSFGDANALKHLKKSNTPCLFIHGDKDWQRPAERGAERSRAKNQGGRRALCDHSLF